MKNVEDYLSRLVENNQLLDSYADALYKFFSDKKFTVKVEVEELLREIEYEHGENGFSKKEAAEVKKILSRIVEGWMKLHEQTLLKYVASIKSKTII